MVLATCTLDSFKIPKAEFVLSWTVFGRPKKVQQRIRKVRFQMEQEKSRYHEEMKDQQARFESLLIILHQEVVGFSRYDDLAKVDIVADHVAKVKNKIRNAVEQARLFNNREALFGQALTPYDNLATIQKIFEPYVVPAAVVAGHVHNSAALLLATVRAGTKWSGKLQTTGSSGTSSGWRGCSLNWMPSCLRSGTSSA